MQQQVQVTKVPPGKARMNSRERRFAKFVVDNGETLKIDVDLLVVEQLTGRMVRAGDAGPEDAIEVPKAAGYGQKRLALRDAKDWKKR